MKLRDSFLSLIKGVIIGMSSLISCLSSGSVVYSLSIYDNFIEGISDVFKRNNRKLYLVVIPMLLGIIGGLLGGINAVDYFMTKFPNQTLFLFVGLLLGGLKINCNKSNASFNIKTILLFLLVFCFSFFLYILLDKYVSFSLNENYFFKFLFGLFIGITIIIPGLPLSSFLSSFDKYNYLSNMVSSISLSNVISLMLFIIGILIGIFIISNIIYRLLKRSSSILSIIFLSLLFTSIIIILFNLTNFAFTFNCIFTSILSFLWGYILAINLEKENDR